MEPTFLPYGISSVMPSPPRADSIFDSLPEVLDKLERDEHLALLAPTYNHSKEPTGNLFIQPLETETLRKFGQPDALPNVASLCRRITRKTFDIRFNSVELNALADGPQNHTFGDLGAKDRPPGPARKSVPDHKTRHQQDFS